MTATAQPSEHVARAYTISSTMSSRRRHATVSIGGSRAQVGFSRASTVATRGADRSREDADRTVRDYVSRLWAEDWDSPEDSVYDTW